MVRGGWLWQGADDHVQLVDSESRPTPGPAALLRQIAAEAVILQDEAEAVLADVARHEHLGVVALRGGPLVSRFFALRQRLPPSCGDIRLNRLGEVLDTIPYHHAMQVATAMDFLTFDGRSEQLHRQISSFTGLGASAALLEDAYRELTEHD